MKPKKVTIDAPITAPSLQEDQLGRQTLHNHVKLHRNAVLPRHMLPLGHDGYRTPTIEDFESEKGRSPTGHGLTMFPMYHDPRLPSNHPLQSPYPSPSLDGRHHWNLSHPHLAPHVLEHLHWRERIRHYTWTFFTMTMATGGIANVLYQGANNLKHADVSLG